MKKLEDKPVWVVKSEFFSNWREREKIIKDIKKKHGDKTRVSFDENIIIFQYKNKENVSVFN